MPTPAATGNLLVGQGSARAPARRGWYVVTSGVVALVGNLVSGVAALVLGFVTFLPGTVVLIRIAATRNRRIRESVRSRMSQMDVATLIVLLDNLEQVYGADMKPLRTLLPAGADNYRA